MASELVALSSHEVIAAALFLVPSMGNKNQRRACPMTTETNDLMRALHSIHS